MNCDDRPIYRFKSFRLDLAERQLLQHDLPILLPPKAFDVLALLVERAGHLVEKEELMQVVWPDSFVQETNVTRIVHTLRRTLGENDNGNKFIETVPTRGYRFIAKVQHAEADERRVGQLDFHEAATESNFDDKLQVTDIPEPANSVGQPSISGVRRIKRLFNGGRFYLGIAVLLLLAVGLSFYLFTAREIAPVEDGRISIAVLPLMPINTAIRDEIIEIGVADSLIHRLSSMKGFVIRPLSATRKYVDVDLDVILAGKEQQVDYVISSNYQMADGRIRINWQLIRVADGQIIETYISEKETGKVFEFQDAVANEIGNILSARFATSSNIQSARRGTRNEEAYRKYLQGMYLYDKRTMADARKAVELLDQSVGFDPNYARAWAGKAHAHRSLGNFGGNTHEEYSQSIQAVSRALAIDPNSADAHSALCENKYFYEWNFQAAEHACRTAIQLDTNSSLAHDVYARFLYGRGRFDEAISEMKIAIDLEPTSLFSQRNYGISLYYARRYREAITQFKRVTEMDPNFVATYAWLVPALHAQGNEAEAYGWFMKWQTVLKTDEESMQAYKKEFQTSGWPGIGRERVKRFDEGKIRSYFLEACLTVYTGDRDKAFEYLEKSLERREWGMSYIHIDPSLDALRADPRFDDLVRRADLK